MHPQQPNRLRSLIFGTALRIARFLFSLTALLPLGAAEANNGFSVEETSRGVTVKFNGNLFTNYVIGDANKPYLWPVIGPTGKRMTRAFPMEKIDGEKQDHPHHRSVWFGHQEMGGFDTWHEPLSYTYDPKKAEKFKDRLQSLGSTVHREFTEISADDDKAVIATINDYVDVDGNKIMEDERRLTFRADENSRIIDVDLTLVATRDVTLDAAKDAGLSIRVAHSMSVDAGEGGRIINSEGQTDKEAWSQNAAWCVNHGPVEGETLGVAVLNHPSSFRHPTMWHVRTYGLFTANPFMGDDGAVTMKAGDRVTLRHRILFHKGDEKAAKIAEAYARYAAEE